MAVDNYVPDDPDTATNLDGFLTATDHVLAYNHVTNAGFDFEILTSEIQLSVQQLMHRLNVLAASVNLFMNTGLADGGANPPFAGEFNYTAGLDETLEHLRFDVRSDGRLEIKGTRAFWGCFSIEVPSPQYQFGFWGDRLPTDDNTFQLRRFLSVHPESGAKTFNKIKVNPVLKKAKKGETLSAQEVAYNRRTLFGGRPRVIHTAYPAGIADASRFASHAGNSHSEVLTVSSQASIFSTLERRVALEVGCSLPIKNSPMIDHQRETPDFVLGRWIWRTGGRIESNDRGGSRRYGSTMPACIQYQGPQDRITYHELQAQAKIQTLRIKLLARVRSFDQTTETWTMRVVQLPTNSTDWWHARIHFVSKD